MATGGIKQLAIRNVTGNNQTLVAAVPAAGLMPNQKIRIRALSLTLSGTGTVTFHDDNAVPVSGAFAMVAGEPLVMPDNPEGWGDTSANQALQVDVSAGNLAGVLSYQLVN